MTLNIKDLARSTARHLNDAVASPLGKELIRSLANTGETMEKGLVGTPEGRDLVVSGKVAARLTDAVVATIGRRQPATGLARPVVDSYRAVHSAMLTALNSGETSQHLATATVEASHAIADTTRGAGLYAAERVEGDGAEPLPKAGGQAIRGNTLFVAELVEEYGRGASAALMLPSLFGAIFGHTQRGETASPSREHDIPMAAT